MKLYLVGTSDVEFTDTRYVCLFKSVAMKKWEELREELIDKEYEMIAFCMSEGYSFEIHTRCLKNLGEKDPEKMNNYPQERPFIHEMELTLW